MATSARTRSGGVEGNELLTSAAAAVLTILLLAEGVTIIDMGGLLGPHMVIGLVLIPPVLLKLASTGYRMVRYYTGSLAYRLKGPPLLPLRVLAPALVATTVMIFVTGVWLLAVGHKSDQLLLLHKVAFFVWGGLFGVHFLAYLPRAARALATSVREWPLAGGHMRALLVAAALGAGVILALSMDPLLDSWHRAHGF